MSSNTKIGLTLIVAVLLVAVAAYLYRPDTSDSGSTTTEESQTSQTQSAAAQPAATADTSDDAIVQGSGEVDAQVTALTKDNANMNQSDQPVAQSY